ncbi:copper-binding protein [Pseudomonas cavernicola]|uniref:Copper-binding protein n=1 Tax=Pseudomonas cavernicola TaxID=2320866 RepID=A0A418X8B5_9PSED|nr:copper-binding protein [Pseudomonas cavernicola]RJG08681.1 copper-binding protein [Pseudomonas cavernicola]
MRTFKPLFLPVLLIMSMIGFDNIYAAGDLTRLTTALPDLLLGSEASDYYSMSQQEYQLETGKAYQLKIIASGQKEYAFQAPEFATSIFLRKVEAGGVEIKAVTLTELEFEDAGEAEIFFVPIKPGQYRFYAKGLEGKGMQGVFIVK